MSHLLINPPRRNAGMMIDCSSPDRITASGGSVWCIKHPEKYAEADVPAGLLSAEEQERAARFIFEKDRNRYRYIRGTLRHILGVTLGMDPSEVVFTYNEFGRPETSGDRAVSFSVSHAAEYSCIAIQSEGRIGIDLEFVHRIHDYHSIAESFFTEYENEEWKQIPPQERRAAFFKWWVQKEAYLKYLGTGISGGLSGFDVDVNPDREGRIIIRGVEEGPSGLRDPQVELWKPVEGYIAAVCSSAG